VPRNSLTTLAATPPWLLLVPVLLIGLVWYMSRFYSRQPPAAPGHPASKRPPRRTATAPPPAALPALPAPVAGAPAPSSGPPRRWVTPRKGLQYEPHFIAATAKYGLPAGLLSRLAQRESIYDPNAVSPVGAIGLMQIMPKHHPDLDPGELALDRAAALDPKRAIPYAAKYLRQLYDRFGTWTLAVAAYNAGPTAVKKYGGVPPFKETRAYVAAILPDVGIAQPEQGVRYA